MGLEPTTACLRPTLTDLLASPRRPDGELESGQVTWSASLQ